MKYASRTRFRAATAMLAATLGLAGSAGAGDCANLIGVGSEDTPGLARRSVIVGTFAYVADGSSGLQVLDLANPTSPVIVGSFNTPGFAYDVAVSGTHAYVADGTGGLQIIDVSDPANPAFVGKEDEELVDARCVAVSGRLHT